jgi:murein L,D-transpeptidase YcbB/YkuD
VALDYANHAQAGRVDPKSINSEFLDLRPVRPEPGLVLTGLAKAGDQLASHLESYHPTHPQFQALTKKLAEASSAIRSGSAPIRIPEGPSLGPDTYHPQVAIVRERLSVAPPLDAPRGNPEEFFDDTLAEAVRVFQETRGLRPDGIVGRNTREALNEGTIPVSINTIISNMERWRWAPRDFGERHVFINVPEFKFQVISSGKVIHEERIVTGSPKHPTPVFSDVMETVVFNPYWNVPRSILENEILPAARNNLDYLYRNNMEVLWQGRRSVDPYMVDWHYVDPKKLTLRQRPGPGNALGQVKFLFPNKHAVYMHDTPSKHLFNKPVRAYSHGCMRVRNPLEFARLLLRDQGWTESRIQNALDGGSDQHVRLENKLPVHISYFTAWVEEDGTLRGFRDVYGHDASVRVALKLDSRKMLASSEQDFEIGEQGLRN